MVTLIVIHFLPTQEDLPNFLVLYQDLLKH